MNKMTNEKWKMENGKWNASLEHHCLFTRIGTLEVKR